MGLCGLGIWALGVLCLRLKVDLQGLGEGGLEAWGSSGCKSEICRRGF